MKLAESVCDWRDFVEVENDPFADLRRNARASRSDRVATRTVKAEALRWYAMSGQVLQEAAMFAAEPPGRNTLASRFSEMRDRWMWSNFSVSNPATLVQDPDFLGIIGMGRPGIPFVLRELMSSRNPLWFYALPAMAHQDPAEHAESADEALSLWMRWGEARGLI